MTARNELTVADLVSRARRGDVLSFENLIVRHERMALGVAYGVLRDPQLAGDVVQEAFVKAWRRLSGLTSDASFPAWLCGIVRNLCVDQQRRKKLSVRGIEEAHAKPDTRHPAPLEELHRQEQSQRIAAALDSLDEVTRSAMVLRYYENMSSQQIADMLGLSAPAVDMRLMRGRAALKEKLLSEVH